MRRVAILVGILAALPYSSHAVAGPEDPPNVRTGPPSVMVAEGKTPGGLRWKLGAERKPELGLCAGLKIGKGFWNTLCGLIDAEQALSAGIECGFDVHCVSWGRVTKRARRVGVRFKSGERRTASLHVPPQELKMREKFYVVFGTRKGDEPALVRALGRHGRTLAVADFRRGR